ncbi:MAG TPA: hypothetical protein VIX87_08950 [Steroidobacteraceae bacterium]
MKPVNVLIWIVVVLAIVFVIINWATFGSPIQVSFGFARVSAPLGLVLLGLVLALTAAFVALLLAVQLRVVATQRRHSAELRAQRELVDKAEASRFTELRQYLERELDALREEQRACDQRVRDELLTATNTLSACIGQIDERLERQWPSADMSGP